MGLLDRFRKEERLHIDPESRKTEWIPIKRKPKREEIKELTREEQMEPKRSHPWQTPRGKRVVKKVGSGLKRIDKAVVSYNRRRPTRPTRGGGPSFGYSTHRNPDPFGSTFDTGMQPMKHPRKKKKTSSKTKYTVVGGKAYPIAGTSVRKHKKKKTTSKKGKPRSGMGMGSFDIFDNQRF